jgi:two-component system cell cycle sensor histidine kinase/response regulator CckA
MVPKTVQVTLALPGEAAWVSANEAALLQVIINLVQNARDALDEKAAGAITLTCDLVPNGRALMADATQLDGVACVRLCVTDNGPGIDAALLNRIFEPFFTTKGERGSGLGLAMARETARRHAGALRAISSPGAGATFELLLPVAPPVEDTANSQMFARNRDLSDSPRVASSEPWREALGFPLRKSFNH